ncbi:hypothetical protein DXG01_010483 [Tephrocybe rancida]|nr:hypothetical protein DXG01_010483 [Tephrocybe rancida]
MALVARVIRDQALDLMFNQLSYTGASITEKIRGIHQAREDIKGAIRKLQLKSTILDGDDDDSSVIFQFLRTLPNLQVFEYTQIDLLVPPSEVFQLFDSIRHAPLSELFLDTGIYSFTVEGPPVEGIASLEKLSIRWPAGDNPDVPGSSLHHLYCLIRTSLGTLVELTIENSPRNLGADLDLNLLRDAGQTLRVFNYKMRSHDEGVLEAIPQIFPHLKELALTWSRITVSYSLRWKDSYIPSLTKNRNLIDLRLSSDFEEDLDDAVRADEDHAWYIRCYKRRLEATKKISEAMPHLRKCSWLQLRVGHYGGSSMTHPFVVEERAPNHQGAQLVLVVRGVKQNWMGANERSWGKTVKCKLEDLPGEIIGENDPDADEDVRVWAIASMASPRSYLLWADMVYTISYVISISLNRTLDVKRHACSLRSRYNQVRTRQFWLSQNLQTEQ